MTTLSGLNTLDTKETLDYDNLSIITRPRPPRRRQSGLSLVPFRPYVKCLTSVRQPFSFANGFDKWTVTGKDEIFFTQPNARCIGSLLDDCDISDVIRWDIEGESTRLPMMCKLWMIVDGAVVERGRPHLVQDAAIQVYTAGRNHRAILAAGQRYHPTTTTTFDRRRRQSWHDINEYHSVPYNQYTYPIRKGFAEGIQCDIDNEHLNSREEILSDVEEEVLFDEDEKKSFAEENLRATIHHLSLPEDRVHVSITTQTESPFLNRSTSIDDQFLQMFNLKFETNEILLSSIVDPYRSALATDKTLAVEGRTIDRKGKKYQNRAVSTADDYPHWWLRLSTDVLLSDVLTNENEEKETKRFLPPPPSPRQDQSIQTDLEKSRSSSRSSQTPKSSSSNTINNHYDYIDEENLKRFSNSSANHLNNDSHANGYQLANFSPARPAEPSAKQSDTDYQTFVSSLRQHSYSTPDYHNNVLACPCLSNTSTRTRTKSSESTSTILLTNLLERYERTLRDRQRTVAIVNDELLNIEDVLKHYRTKIQTSPAGRSSRAVEVCRKMPSEEDSRSLIITNLLKDKYRAMPGITSEEMIRGYIPAPRLHPVNSIILSPRQRPTRVLPLTRPDYCDLCVTPSDTSSAWIKYNERRIEEFQKRIDLMLQIDDNEDVQLLLSSTPIKSTTATVTQRIDDILTTRYRSPDHKSIVLSTRLPYRLNQSVPSSSRLTTRNATRSSTPLTKSVRISTHSTPVRPTLSSSSPRPIVSILRRSHTPQRVNLSSDVRQSRFDSELHASEQFQIPRYYRLYNDVSFREMYQFSRILDTYMHSDGTLPSSTAATGNSYSSMAKRFALEQRLPSSITSAA